MSSSMHPAAFPERRPLPTSTTQARKPSHARPRDETTSALEELFADEQGQEKDLVPGRAQGAPSFAHVLERLATKHEAYREDTPENDLAFQSLLSPIEASHQAAAHLLSFASAPPMTPATLHKSTLMPDRPKTSPSKLALSVVLAPEAQSVARSMGSSRPALRLLDPPQHAQEETEPPTVPLPELDESKTLSFGPRDLDEASETFGTLLTSRKDEPLSLVSRQEAAVKTLPPPPPLKLSPLPSPKLDAAPALITPEGTAASSSVMTSDAVLETGRARRMSLQMEQTPKGQRIELEIADSFGKPLTLEITFEHQRARAACYGSRFHDPNQLEYVLDAVRTALEASGYELGDFITHHQKKRRHAHDEDHAPDTKASAKEGDAQVDDKPEVIHIVGIINRIA